MPATMYQFSERKPCTWSRHTEGGGGSGGFGGVDGFGGVAGFTGSGAAAAGAGGETAGGAGSSGRGWAGRGGVFDARATASSQLSQFGQPGPFPPPNRSV